MHKILISTEKVLLCIIALATLYATMEEIFHLISNRHVELADIDAFEGLRFGRWVGQLLVHRATVAMGPQPRGKGRFGYLRGDECR